MWLSLKGVAPLDTAYEAIHWIGVFAPKVHPSHGFKEKRKLGQFACVRENNWNHGTVTLHKLTEECFDLLLLPWADPITPDEDSGRVNFSDLLL
jgi:hypothetical protein